MRSTGKASRCIPFFYFEQQPNSPRGTKFIKVFPWPAAPRGAAGARAGFVSFVPLWCKKFFEQVSLEIN